jgi:ubiquinone/menaquinone biosynthesis C-methylase UbiE
VKKLTRPAINAFLKKYSSPLSTLDIGASGDDHREYFPNRTTLDIDPSKNSDVVGDAHALPFKDGSFEVVVCSEMLEHANNPQTVIEEIRRVLKTDGLVVLTTRFAFPIHDAPNDYWRFTPYGLRRLFSEFDVIEVTTDGRSFHTIAVLLQRILFQTNLPRIIKGLLYPMIIILPHLDRFISHQYGNITRTTEVDHLLSSGVFIAARKRI